jgi:hypothetical protein
MSNSSSSSQILQRKFQSCRNKCGHDIFFENSKLGRTDKGKWVPLQLDSLGQVVKHDCPNNNKKQQSPPQQPLPAQQQQPPVSSETTSNIDLSKEIAAVKAQLLVLVGRLDRLEQEYEARG